MSMRMDNDLEGAVLPGDETVQGLFKIIDLEGVSDEIADLQGAAGNHCE